MSGTKRKPPDQAQARGTQELPHEDGRTEDGEPTGKTTTGRPRPADSARDAHEPEPAPEKQREGEGEGTTPGGQGEETKPTKPAPGPEE